MFSVCQVYLVLISKTTATVLDLYLKYISVKKKYTWVEEIISSTGENSRGNSKLVTKWNTQANRYIPT